MVNADSSSSGAAEAGGVPTGLAIFTGWAVFLPLGSEIAAYLLMGLASVRWLVRTGTARDVLRHPVFVAALGLWLLLLVSATWTSAPRGDVVAHLWSYSLLLWVAPIALACGPGAAASGLRHFVLAAALVASVLLVDAAGWIAAVAGRPAADAITGNQRIAYSLLLALASALAVWRAFRAGPEFRWRWAAAALLCAAGLATQDRRSGMLVLPVLLLALAFMQQGHWPRRAALAALVALGTAVAFVPLPGVHQRFAEGLGELRDYRSEGRVETSWGMRARMVEITWAMVAERPLSGHGVGSWATEWRRRVHGGLLQGHTTPHNEYLLVAHQTGGPGLALLLGIAAAAAAGIRRRGAAAQGAMMVLLTLMLAGAFNAVLRDTKFALPLLSLAALSWAAARAPLAAMTPAGPTGPSR